MAAGAVNYMRICYHITAATKAAHWAARGCALKKIVLISCVSKKQPHRAKAKDLYISLLFRKNMAYAKIARALVAFACARLIGQGVMRAETKAIIL